MGKNDKPDKNNSKKQKHFWKDFKAELKKVIWPTRSQVVNNTIIVIVIVLIVTAICFVLDLAFEALNTYGIDKLKQAVQDSVSNTVEENTTQDNEIADDTNTVSDDTSIVEEKDSNIEENDKVEETNIEDNTNTVAEN